MKKIKVLVVEDSIVFRELLVRCLRADPMIEVVATAADPYEARDAIIKFAPDVMTLDIELPRMNGIEFLKKLMPQYPIPTVVISALSDAVFDALSAGAVEFVGKTSNLSSEEMGQYISSELVTKVKIASTVKVGKLKNFSANTMSSGSKIKSDTIIAIGASTGGTEAIYEVLKHFHRDIPGTVVVQHMPPGFTRMYAERLNEQCEVAVKEAVTGDRVLPGQVLVAPGDVHMRVLKMSDGYRVECKEGPKVSGHCPSVDALFESVARAAGKQAVGVLLTGMGADGAKGLLEMRNKGASTIGQDEVSSIVYGMPKVAYECGAVQYQMPLTGIARKIYEIVKYN